MTTNRPEVVESLRASLRGKGLLEPDDIGAAALRVAAVDFEFDPPPTAEERHEAGRLAVADGDRQLKEIRDFAKGGPSPEKSA